LITAYRLVKKKRQETAFDGVGAKRSGGRWNNPGRACCYLASTVSLGLLEIMVHLQNYKALQDYIVFSVNFDESDCLDLPASQLPENWSAPVAPPSVSAIGDLWLSGLTSPLLKIPSAVVGLENNYLLNPEHTDCDRIVKTSTLISYQPDLRL